MEQPAVAKPLWRKFWKIFRSHRQWSGASVYSASGLLVRISAVEKRSAISSSLQIRLLNWSKSISQSVSGNTSTMSSQKLCLKVWTLSPWWTESVCGQPSTSFHMAGLWQTILKISWNTVRKKGKNHSHAIRLRRFSSGCLSLWAGCSFLMCPESSNILDNSPGFTQKTMLRVKRLFKPYGYQGLEWKYKTSWSYQSRRWRKANLGPEAAKISFQTFSNRSWFSWFFWCTCSPSRLLRYQGFKKSARLEGVVHQWFRLRWYWDSEDGLIHISIWVANLSSISQVVSVGNFWNGLGQKIIAEREKKSIIALSSRWNWRVRSVCFPRTGEPFTLASGILVCEHGWTIFPKDEFS